MKSMKEGWFIIIDPKYKVPSVFDLHHISRFREAPQVQNSVGARIVANDDLQVGVEFRYLVETPSQYEGKNYNLMTKQGLIVLSVNYALDLIRLDKEIDNIATRKEIIAIHEVWSREWLPRNEFGQIDVDAAQEKIAGALREAKKKFRAELKRRNEQWINAKLPAIRQSFARWPESSIFSEDLYAAYEKLGGNADEVSLLKQIAQFYTVCFTTEPDGLKRLDGNVWENEDDIWDCWLGFVGDEYEANILFKAMEQVFRPVETNE